MSRIKETLDKLPEVEVSRQTYLEISTEIGERLLKELDQPFHPSDLFKEVSKRNIDLNVNEIDEILQIWNRQG